MKTQTHIPALLVAACALFAPAAHANSPFRIKTKANVTIAFDLQPTAAAAVGVSGEAVIRVKPKKEGRVRYVKLETTGLAAGSYSVDATNADATTTHLGDFAIDPAVDDPATPEDESLLPPASTDEIKISLAADIDVLAIASLSISDATPAVILEGAIASTDGKSRFFANVRVTAPPVITTLAPGTPKPKKVHGHALLISGTEDGAEVKRHVLWVGFGAPAETELTILVDGVATGTVTSTKAGKVKFSSLPPEVTIPSIKLIQIADALGAVVMQADLEP